MVFQDHVLVELTCNSFLKCDREDIHIVEDYVWCISSNSYATTTHNGHTLSFHNVVMNFKPTRHTTIDHINRDPLNCCRSNLHMAGKRTQSSNHSMGKNNRSGIVGVYYKTKSCLGQKVDQ